MADFTPKLSTEKGKAKGSLPKDNSSEHQSPPRLYLEHHHLEKLGMDKMPAVGSKIKISGLAHVGSTSEDDDPGIDGGKRRSMTLHLHKMDMGTDNSEESQKDGMKGAIDKALSKAAGSEAEKGNAKGKTPPVRGGGD
jgi:hypothetical protein